MPRKSLKKRAAPKESRKKYSHLPNIVCGFVACFVGAYFSHSLWGIHRATVTSEYVAIKNFNVTCSTDYQSLPKFEDCTPTKLCGRVVQDDVITTEEASRLVGIAKRGFSHGGSSGGASILDLHSGALSMGDKFINIFKYLDSESLVKTFSNEDFNFYSKIKARVHYTIAKEFGVQSSRLFLTHPTFFSRITNMTAKTTHDEYWHEHVDKIQYGSFDYTSLLYLSDYGKDFTGGRFIFDGENSLTVEPRKGRLSFFTSGSENPHHVEKVQSGVRYAITISFTCDPKKAIKDPKLRS